MGNYTIKMTDNYVEHQDANTSTYKNKGGLRKLGEAAMEGLATYLFVLIIYCSTFPFQKNIHGPTAPVFVFGFWVILSVFGRISGGHVNPAVTIGLYFVDGDWIHGLMKMGLYFVFQFAGAYLAVLSGFWAVGNQNVTIFPPQTVYHGSIFFAEFMATGSFLFIIAIATHAKYPPTNFAPINCAVIIGWFYTAATAASYFSGGALNPAVLIAINSTTEGAGHMKFVPLMVLGEVLGVIFFAFVFKFVYSPFLAYVMEDEPVKNSEGFQEAKLKADA